MNSFSCFFSFPAACFPSCFHIQHIRDTQYIVQKANHLSKRKIPDKFFSTGYGKMICSAPSGREPSPDQITIPN